MKRAFSSLAVAVTVASSPFCLSGNCLAQDAAAPAASPAAASPAPETKPAAVDLSRYKTADALWDYIREWSVKEPELDENLDRGVLLEKINAFIADARAHLAPACEEFLRRYPQDPRRWDVKLVALTIRPSEGNASNLETEKVLQEVADATDASAKARQKARLALLGAHLQQAGEGDLPPEAESEIAAYEKDYPDDPNGAQFVALRLHSLGENPAPAQIAELMTRLSTSPNTSTAAVAKARLSLYTSPLDWKFTATDGREVDLTKMRGKVVLIDFWATWCGPCVQELPNVIAAYRKYHDKGFEIVGVSLDKDKAELEKFIKAKEMTWPQYFDGKFLETAFARRYGIEGIPAIWLVGKDGMVADFNAREDLEDSIEKLLAARPGDAPAAPSPAPAAGGTAPAVKPSGAASQP